MGASRKCFTLSFVYYFFIIKILDQFVNSMLPKKSFKSDFLLKIDWLFCIAFPVLLCYDEGAT